MNLSGIETLKIGDSVKFVVNRKENIGKIIDVNKEGGTVRVELKSALYKNEFIKMWVPYFLIAKVD